MLKSANLSVGETFQCQIDGIEVDCEQTSHHPPISHIFMKTKEWQYDGYVNPQVQFGGNNLEIIPYGKDKITFNNTGAEIYMNFPIYNLKVSLGFCRVYIVRI